MIEDKADVITGGPRRLFSGCFSYLEEMGGKVIHVRFRRERKVWNSCLGEWQSERRRTTGGGRQVASAKGTGG